MKTKKFMPFILIAILISGSFILPPPRSEAAVSDWQQAAVIDPRWTTDFASDSFKQSVRDLRAANADMVTLTIPLYQSNVGSTDINPGWNTPTDEALIAGIDFARSLGMQVALKPHTESYDGQWRAHINPGDRAGWFRNYGNILERYARIGEAHGVSMIVIGSEMIELAAADANPTNTQNWTDLANRIRGVFSGKLAYSANWGGSWWADEKNRIEFWPAVDYIGIASYFVLNTDPSVESLKREWDRWRTTDIEPLQRKWGKPILFTEMGYRSLEGARFAPFDSWSGGNASEWEQAQLYEALFQFWNDYPYFQGVHFWNWESDPNAGWPGSTSYTSQNKAAEEVMRRWFGGTAAPPEPEPTCAATGTNAFTGCYYDNSNFTGLKFTRTDSAINFDWGSGSPDPRLSNDTFSVRWQGSFSFEQGEYEFRIRTDDGMRLYIGDELILDRWYDQGPTIHTVRRTMAAGTHSVKLEYYENGGGAVAALEWAKTAAPPPPAACASDAANAFAACYKDADSTVARQDAAVNFDWGSGSPDPQISADNFTAEWHGTFDFAAGEYEFTATMDDGMQVFVDGTAIIDKYFDQPPTAHTARVTLGAGPHKIDVRYYENGGGAVARLSWRAVTGGTPAPTSTPTSTPPSSGQVDVWWPSDGASISGTQPFKAIVRDRSVDTYDMWWQVDGDRLNGMYTSTQDYPHKEAMVDVSGWNWKGAGPYVINFVAKDQAGNLLGSRSVSITVIP